MNNPNRVDQLSLLTRDLAMTYEIVATSSDRSLKYLDKFLNEFVDGETLTLRPGKPKVIFVKSKVSPLYSLCIVETEKIQQEEAIVLTVVIGAPLNWNDNEFFEEAKDQVDFSNKPIYQRSYEESEDRVPVRLR